MSAPDRKSFVFLAKDEASAWDRFYAAALSSYAVPLDIGRDGEELLDENVGRSAEAAADNALVARRARYARHRQIEAVPLAELIALRALRTAVEQHLAGDHVDLPQALARVNHAREASR